MATEIMLKPCGHCNNKAELMIGESGLGGEVKCTECGMRTGWYEDPADAIYIWNRRDGEVDIVKVRELFGRLNNIVNGETFKVSIDFNDLLCDIEQFLFEEDK